MTEAAAQALARGRVLRVRGALLLTAHGRGRRLALLARDLEKHGEPVRHSVENIIQLFTLHRVYKIVFDTL